MGVEGLRGDNYLLPLGVHQYICFSVVVAVMVFTTARTCGHCVLVLGLEKKQTIKKMTVMTVKWLLVFLFVCLFVAVCAFWGFSIMLLSPPPPPPPPPFFSSSVCVCVCVCVPNVTIS